MEEEVKVRNVFTNKNFVLAFLGAFVSNMGNILYSFAVSFYILYLTNNNALIQGLYLATGGIVFTIVVLCIDKLLYCSYIFLWILFSKKRQYAFNRRS